MGMNDLLAEAMVEEYEEKGKKISFELARLVVQAETCDGSVKLMMHIPELSAEKIAAFLGVSLRFVEISMAQHGRVKKRKPESEVIVWEQIWEMRKRDDSESYWSKDRVERREKEFSIRISEQIEAVKIFLANPDYSVHKIADLVGISVSSVELIKGAHRI
jgi:hypothetical protein